MSHPLIDALTELEEASSKAFWTGEDRTAWRDDLLRQSLSRDLVSLQKLISSLAENREPHQTGRELIHVSMWDSDLQRCFGNNSTDEAQLQYNQHFEETLNRIETSTANTVVPVYLRPGFWMNESWIQEEEPLRRSLAAARSQNALTLRCGFLTQQADIYLAADLGFSAVQIHARGLDLYELQMAVELARDCRLCPIVSAANEDEVEQVIQTDAPHIALCYFPDKAAELSARFVQRTLPRIPNNCSKILLAATQTNAEIQLLTKLGFDLAIQFNPIAPT